MMKRIKKYIGLLGLFLVISAAVVYIMVSEFNLAVTILAISGSVLILMCGLLYFEEIKKIMLKRSTRLGTNTVIFCFAILVIVFVINYISFRHNKRFDLTSSKIYSLSEKTVNILKGISREVGLKCFFQDDSPEKESIEDLLVEYKYHSDKIKVEFIDPDKKPQVTKDAGIREYGTILFESGPQKTRVTKSGEEDITNAFIKVTHDKEPVLYFITGHGEKQFDDTDEGGYSFIRDALKDENYNLKEIVLAQSGGVPGDCDVLVVTGPTAEYIDIEKNMIIDYLKKGKGLLLMLDPSDKKTGLEEILEEWGIELGEGFIVDPISRLFGASPMIPVVFQYKEHEITKGFNLQTFFPEGRPVKTSSSIPDGVDVVEIALSSPTSWAETGIREGDIVLDDAEEKGPLSIILAANRKTDEKEMADGRSTDEGEDKEGEMEEGEVDREEDESKAGESRMVVIGDSDFASNNYVNLSGNYNLFLNIVNWLSEEEDLISIRPKSPGYRGINLTRNQGRSVYLFTVAAIPLAIIFIGGSVWWKRRRL